MPRLVCSHSLLEVLDIVELLVLTHNGIGWPVLIPDNYWPVRAAENVNRGLTLREWPKNAKVQGRGFSEPRTLNL